MSVPTQPPAKRQRSAPRLPFIGLKRAHSASGEQNEEKRQFLGEVPYEDILKGTVAQFRAMILNCNPALGARGVRADYFHVFKGRNTQGQIDENMRFHITAGLVANGLAGAYRVRMRVADGARNVIMTHNLQESEGYPTQLVIECRPDMTDEELQSALEVVVYTWLSFVNRHFSLAQPAGPLAPDQYR